MAVQSPETAASRGTLPLYHNRGHLRIIIDEPRTHHADHPGSCKALKIVETHSGGNNEGEMQLHTFAVTLHFVKG